MRDAVAVSWVVALCLAVVALGLRADPRVLRRVGIEPSPPPAGRARGPGRQRPVEPGSVADVLDLVSVAVAAGLGPGAALHRAGDAVGGSLAEELAVARRDVELGTPWRTALRAAAERSGDRDLRRLAVLLDRAERLGTPVAEGLRALARQVREERRVEEEERARRAPVAMLFPLVFCILPAFVVSALVPALIAAAGSAT